LIEEEKTATEERYSRNIQTQLVKLSWIQAEVSGIDCSAIGN